MYPACDAACCLCIAAHLQVDAFWCFVGLMELIGGNFAQDQAGMHTQLAALRQLVQVRLTLMGHTADVATSAATASGLHSSVLLQQELLYQ
jgi:hypothetical protein